MDVFEFAFDELALDGLFPTLASTLAFSEAFPAALCALLAAVFAIECAVDAALLALFIAPFVSTFPEAEPLAATVPPPDATLALPLPVPEPLAALDALCAVLLAEDRAASAVPVAVFVVDEVSAFPCAFA